MKKTLTWHEYRSLRDAINHGYGEGRSFVYVVTSSKRKALYVGMASNGFLTRYRGGTHTAIDAALSSSRKSVLLAEVEKDKLHDVEKELIFAWKDSVFNIQGRHHAPNTGLKVVHEGKNYPL